MSVIGSNIIAGASGTVETGYQISRSLRFNSADSAYLNRTPASAGNRRKWTYSTWIKRTTLGDKKIFSGGTGTTDSTFLVFFFGSADNLRVSGYSTDFLITTQVFRDLSAFYHIILVADTDNATSSDRLQLYVNGSRITAFSTASYPTGDLGVNNTQAHNIGRSTTGANPLDAYFADTIFVDGQALTPSSFGETDTNTGVWVPKAYTGTYGTNGFWLKFDDNSGVTATTLGKDSSGNGNNWTPNNFSVTAGVGNDSLVDSPTNYGTDTGAGGEVRGNYATLNPLAVYAANFTLSNGNLDAVYTSSSNAKAIATMAIPTSGRWYFEVTPTTISSGLGFIGVTTEALVSAINGEGSYRSNGAITNLANTAQTSGSTYASNDVIGVAVNCDAGTVQFYKNGVAQGATPSFSFTAGTVLYPAICTDNVAGTKAFSFNFGQRPFAYTAPSGFKALCTTNLPTPAIGASASTLASKNFNVVTYTGNATTTGTTQSITGVGFQPDFVWIKSRSSGTYWHMFNDAVRGANKLLYSNATDSEGTLTDVFQSFNADGFTVSNNTAFSVARPNVNAETYVAWNWKANGAGVSNTAGSITSTVSANTAAGISVVTYTGNGTAGATVGHGLGVTPAMVIFKNRSATFSWAVFHRSITTQASGNVWDSSVVNLGSKSGGVTQLNLTQAAASYGMDGQTNGSGNNHVAYCFAEVAGFSKFGSYTGNGSTDGVFLYCGFRPRYIMVKQTNAIGNWIIWDTARSTFNQSQKYVVANGSDAEGDLAAVAIDILSNGFKCRTTDNDINGSGDTYIFAAFAEAAFNFSRAR